MEDGMQYYPEDMYTDMPMYRIICEVVREKILTRTKDEIPHSIAVEILGVTRKESGRDVYNINVYVERKSQKGIVIGEGGKLLKAVTSEARKDLEEIMGKKNNFKTLG